MKIKKALFYFLSILGVSLTFLSCENSKSNLGLYVLNYTESYIKMRLYSLVFSRNNVILRNFIPVRVGQVGCLYDKVSGQIFRDVGNGSYVLGNDI